MKTSRPTTATVEDGVGQSDIMSCRQVETARQPRKLHYLPLERNFSRNFTSHGIASSKVRRETRKSKSPRSHLEWTVRFLLRSCLRSDHPRPPSFHSGAYSPLAGQAHRAIHPVRECCPFARGPMTACFSRTMRANHAPGRRANQIPVALSKLKPTPN